MNTNLKAPPQFGGNIQEQMQQVQRYLFQLQRDLNVALDSAGGEDEGQSTAAVAKSAAKAESDKAAQSLKALIIKTAHTIQKEVDSWTELLEGSYVAKSEFGEYTQTVSNQITATATEVVQSYHYESLIAAAEDRISDLETENSALKTYKTESEQYTKSGLLYYDDDDLPVYGYAVGEVLSRVIVNGEETVRREDLLATFSAGRLNFWQGGNVVAYYANNKLYVMDGEFLSSLQIGNWRISGGDRLDIDWAGDA